MSISETELSFLADWALHGRHITIYKELIRIAKDMRFELPKLVEQRSVFFRAVALINMLTYEDPDRFAELIDVFEEMEAIYTRNGEFPLDEGEEFKWRFKKRNLVLQACVSKLLKHLKMGNDSNLSIEPDIPDSFKYVDYKKDILILFKEVHEQNPKIYPANDSSCPEYDEDVNSATGLLITVRNDKRKILNRSRILNFFEKNDFTTFKEQMIKFIDSVEVKALKVPVMVANYNVEMRSNEEALHWMATVHEEDWTDDRRASHGPYSSAVKRTAASAAVSSSAVKTSAASASAASAAELISSPVKGTTNQSSTTLTSHSSPAPRVPREIVQSALNSTSKFKESLLQFNSKQRARDPINDILSAADAVGGGLEDYEVRVSSSNNTGGKRATNQRAAANTAATAILALSKKGKKSAAAPSEEQEEVLTTEQDEEEDLLALQQQSGAGKRILKRRSSGSVPMLPNKRLSKSSVAAAKKGNAAAGSSANGSNVLFSESEEEEEIDSEEDGENKKDRTTKASHLRLKHLMHDLPAGSNSFPATLEGSPVAAQQAPKRKRIPEGEKIRKRWSFDEEQALIEGVEKYGVGRWKDILEDMCYVDILQSRTNVNLKDKYRTLVEQGKIQPVE